MTKTRTVLLLGSALASFALSASAQGPYPVKTLNFDLWCQETQQLPPARCDKRQPSDEADFESYRTKVEKYELPYMKGRETGQQLDRAILHNDPVDHPVAQDPAAVSQSPSSPLLPPKP